MKIEVWCSDSIGKFDRWYWHVRSRNGQIVADSEGYTTRRDAVRAAKRFVSAVVRPFARSFPISGEYTKPIFSEKTDKHDITTIRWH